MSFDLERSHMCRRHKREQHKSRKPGTEITSARMVTHVDREVNIRSQTADDINTVNTLKPR